ncbi:MAG TPA: hypothetical protein VFR28_09125 [Allosphingosinicella sp.]|jgi:hypothetical protein|nr:hypothetical protein [Allosphingosinicella sp.]
MIRPNLLGIALLVASAAPASAQVAAAPAGSNPEMQKMFEADQGARLGAAAIDWTVLEKEDAARKARTRVLLDSGALKTADDYYRAAFIFQHGSAPEDFLMAHALAVAATAKGHPKGAWIAAASLDRYLQNIGRKQIYGTQYQTSEAGVTSQDPYDRALVPDSLRQALGVPGQADQEKRRAEFEARYRKARDSKTPK